MGRPLPSQKIGLRICGKIKAVLAEDPEYHAYARTFRRFLRLIKYQAYTDEQGKKRELGVFPALTSVRFYA